MIKTYQKYVKSIEENKSIFGHTSLGTGMRGKYFGLLAYSFYYKKVDYPNGTYYLIACTMYIK
jgi:hypothetical protein